MSELVREKHTQMVALNPDPDQGGDMDSVQKCKI